MRILVVEDEADARDLLVTVLVRQGAEAQSALGAREGFEAFQETRPDLLISDIEMPGESGYDLIARVRTLSPA